MPRQIDEIRLEMRKIIAMRNEARQYSESWFEIQDHLNTLLWVIGAVDQAPSTRFQEKMSQ